MQSTPDDLLSYTFATFPSLAPSHLFSGRACALHSSKRHFLTLSTSLILSSSPFPSAKRKFKELPKSPAIHLFLPLVLRSFDCICELDTHSECPIHSQLIPRSWFFFCVMDYFGDIDSLIYLMATKSTQNIKILMELI